DLLDGQRHKAPIVGPGIVEDAGDHRNLLVDATEIGEARLDALIAGDPVEQPPTLALRLVEDIVPIGGKVAGRSVSLLFEKRRKPGAVPGHQEHRLLLMTLDEEPAFLVDGEIVRPGDMADAMAAKPPLGLAEQGLDYIPMVDRGEISE